ncbi:MAG: NAD(P)H-binding protein [Micrococcales bacterium]|nr:NAD(P)H-binding protein [Micrococcales bacterium]
MAIIHILGGTGYSGAAIAAEAARRGHDVTSVSRRLPEDRVEGVRYVTADVTDSAALDAAIAGAEVVVGALSPRGDMVGALPAAYARAAASTARSGARLVVVGGFGSLRPAPDTPRIFEGEDFPAEYVGESRELGAVLDGLVGEATGDWVYVSPPMIYGAHFPGEATGRYRSGGEIALTSDDGSPTIISGADFARAVVDEIESSAHHRAHLSFAG